MAKPPNSPAPVFPPGRYGHRRDPAAQRRRRYVTYAVGGVVVLAALAITLKLYQQYAQPQYEVTNLVTTNLTDTSVSVRFELRKPAGQSAACTVLGHTRDGHEVGHAEITVPSGGPQETTTVVTYTLATTARAVTGEVPGCGPA